MLSLLLAVSCFFLWGERATGHLPVGKAMLTLATALLGGAVAIWMLSERLRPVDDNPVSRLIHRVSAPALRLFLRRKIAFLCLPALLILIGAGAWIGLPTILRPAERFTQSLGTNLFIISLQFRHLPVTLAVFAGIPVAFCGFKELKMNLSLADQHWAGTEPDVSR